jgi:hypothetical protein
MVSGLRTLAIAGISSLGLVLYMVLWFHWPITLSLAVGALMATLVVMTSASLGDDTAATDAAWRAAAPDLIDTPAEAPDREMPRTGAKKESSASEQDQV